MKTDFISSDETDKIIIKVLQGELGCISISEILNKKADEYAEQKAIEFDLWKLKNKFLWRSRNIWYSYSLDKILSIKEAWDLFIKQTNTETK